MLIYKTKLARLGNRCASTAGHIIWKLRPITVASLLICIKRGNIKNEAPSLKTHERPFVLRHMTDKRYNLSYAYRFDKKRIQTIQLFVSKKKQWQSHIYQFHLQKLCFEMLPRLMCFLLFCRVERILSSGCIQCLLSPWQRDYDANCTLWTHACRKVPDNQLLYRLLCRCITLYG